MFHNLLFNPMNGATPLVRDVGVCLESRCKSFELFINPLDIVI
jgi:hypothetical protein